MDNVRDELDGPMTDESLDEAGDRGRFGAGVCACLCRTPGDGR